MELHPHKIVRPARRIDRLGRVKNFGYDLRGSNLTETWVVAGVTTQRLTFAYDAVGNLTAAANAAGADEAMEYGVNDRTSNVAEPFGVLLTFAYDAGGNRSTVKDNFGGVVTTTYDALDRVVGREMGGVGVTNIRQTRSYTGTGMLATKTDAKWTGSIWQPVVVSTHMYDLGDRVTGIMHGTGTVDGYAYDASSRLTVETINGTAKTYAYDTTDQLMNDNGSALTYDLNGNRTVAGYTTGANNRMTNDGVWAYTYDAEGNVIKRSKGAAAETWVYGYDLNNRLVTAVDSATDGGAATARVTYVYDAIGNRIERLHWNGSITVTERFAQDGWDTSKPGAVGNENFDVVLDLNSTNGLVNRRLYGDGQDDLIAKQTVGGVVTWYLTDRLGSVQSLVDNSGISVGTLAYSAFGSTTTNVGSTDRYQFTGREWDAALGLQFNRDRMYISTSGRWLSEDPSGFSAGDPNLMRYVGNGPTNGRDPSGREEPYWVGKPLSKPDDGLSKHRAYLKALKDEKRKELQLRIAHLQSRIEHFRKENYTVANDLHKVLLMVQEELKDLDAPPLEFGRLDPEFGRPQPNNLTDKPWGIFDPFMWKKPIYPPGTVFPAPVPPPVVIGPPDTEYNPIEPAWWDRQWDRAGGVAQGVLGYAGAGGVFTLGAGSQNPFGLLGGCVGAAFLADWGNSGWDKSYDPRNHDPKTETNKMTFNLTGDEGLGNGVQNYQEFFGTGKGMQQLFRFAPSAGAGSSLGKVATKKVSITSDLASKAGGKTRPELIADLEKAGLKIKGQSPDGRFIEFVDDAGRVRAKIHPPDNATPTHHLHLYDEAGNPLDLALKPVLPTSSAAHIPIMAP